MAYENILTETRDRDRLNELLAGDYCGQPVDEAVGRRPSPAAS